MSIIHAYARGRSVYDQNDRLIAAFCNADLARQFAMRLISGEITIDGRIA